MGVLLEESRKNVYNIGILGTLCTLDAGRLGPNQDCGSEGDPAGCPLKENREPSTKKVRLLQGPRTSVLVNLSLAVGLGVSSILRLQPVAVAVAAGSGAAAK